MKTLILFAHPALEKSRINKVLIKGIQTIPNVTYHDLYQAYPDFDIDVEVEQANGIQATYLDINPDNVDFLRKLGLKVYYGDASRFDLLHAAGAADAKILIVAVDNPVKGIEIVETAKKHFPKLKIIVRSNSYNDYYGYMDLKVLKVYQETYYTSLNIGIDTLKELGLRHYQVSRAAQKFSKADQKAFTQFAKSRKENPNHLGSVKQHFEELEKQMLEIKNKSHDDKDLGWDITAGREDFKKLISKLTSSK